MRDLSKMSASELIEIFEERKGCERGLLLFYDSSIRVWFASLDAPWKFDLGIEARNISQGYTREEALINLLSKTAE